MKIAVIVLGLLSLAAAFPSEEIEVSRLKPRHIWVDLPGAVPENNEPSSRIINGQDAIVGTFKYQAGLIINGIGFCGASLIRDDFVLTAAHCVDDAIETQVILGFHVIQEALSTQQVLVSREHHVHPQWSPSTLTNDVALIRIPRIDRNNPTLQTVLLAPGNAGSFANSRGLLSGWGRTSDESNQIASYLQVIDLEIMTNFRCTLNYFGLIIDDQHLCTFGSNGTVNVGACNGDSGGPLVVSGLQVGIVSFGAVRCSAGFPSVFARVSSFSDYIQRILNNYN